MDRMFIVNAGWVFDLGGPLTTIWALSSCLLLFFWVLFPFFFHFVPFFFFALFVLSFLFPFTGYNGSRMLSDLYVLRRSEEPWIWTKPIVTGTVPRARAGHSMSLVNHKIFVFGGGDGEGTKDPTTGKEIATERETKRNAQRSSSRQPVLKDMSGFA